MNLNLIHIEVDDIDYYCRLCDSAMEATDCASPYCTGYRCLGCDRGCDLRQSDAGHCATDAANAEQLRRNMREHQKRLAGFYHRPALAPKPPGEFE